MTWKPYWHPSESAGSMPEEKISSEEAPASEAIAPSPDPLAQLQAELADARAEAEQWRDRFLRKAAEFDNYRKRTDKEKAESVMLARSSVLLEFLPVADACERALQNLKDTRNDQAGLAPYREGVELVYRQMLDSLERIGVVPIETVGQKFDPHLHEALTREETSQYEQNTIIEELRRGYLFRDRLLRPAQVKVSARPSGED